MARPWRTKRRRTAFTATGLPSPASSAREISFPTDRIYSNVRLEILGHEMINNVGQSESCMVSNVPMIRSSNAGGGTSRIQLAAHCSTVPRRGYPRCHYGTAVIIRSFIRLGLPDNTRVRFTHARYITQLLTTQ